MGPKKQDEIFKLSIAYRYKYRVEGPTRLSALDLVPHPKNRGGDSVKSLHTRLINGMIIEHGFDPIEAGANAVAVEDKPAVAGVQGDFQAHFAKSVVNDPDMAVRLEASLATHGTLPHGHINCCTRNIRGYGKVRRGAAM